MRAIFADTFYWAALLNPRDQWHRAANERRTNLVDIRIVTTETVLIELLNYFSEFSSEMRTTVTETVRDIMVDLDIDYVSHSPESFLDALGLYERRSDKGYSLTDCVSMNVCRERGITEVLTHDDHFRQEGFVVLL